MSPILDSVRSKYAVVATSTLSSEHSGVRAVAEAFDYSVEELVSILAEANMGLSCGKPTATAHLKPRAIVVDLGPGGGLDVFLAAQKISPKGKAIDVDMTPEMIVRTRENAAKSGYQMLSSTIRQLTNDRLPAILSIASSATV